MGSWPEWVVEAVWARDTQGEDRKRDCARAEAMHKERLR